MLKTGIAGFGSVFVLEWLKLFIHYAPTFIVLLQMIIAVLTIIYLFKKIKHFKP